MFNRKPKPAPAAPSLEATTAALLASTTALLSTSAR